MPLPHEQNGIIIRYIITFADEGNVTTFTTRETSLIITNLDPFTSYTFNVSASTGIGSGPESGTLIATTQEDGMPS